MSNRCRRTAEPSRHEYEEGFYLLYPDGSKRFYGTMPPAHLVNDNDIWLDLS